MPPVTTPAVILHAFPYGESSKIVRLLTRDYGVQSAMAKGALRPRSRWGAQLRLLSGGDARVYFKANRDLHTLAGFEVTADRSDLAREIRRFAAGMALAELVLRCAPAEPHPEIHDLVLTGLAHLGDVAVGDLEVAALRLLWTLVRALGFAPHAGACARCGHALRAGPTVFSIADGGFLCRACGAAAGEARTRLPAQDRVVLEAFLNGAEPPSGPVAPDHLAAHRRLLSRFIERHLAEGRELPALAFWAAVP